MKKIKTYTTLGKLNNIVDGSMRSCLNDHPGSIHPNAFTSLKKRIVKALTGHLNVDLHKGFTFILSGRQKTPNRKPAKVIISPIPVESEFTADCKVNGFTITILDDQETNIKVINTGTKVEYKIVES